MGFIMMGYYEPRQYYTLWEFLIDGRYQGRGYGRQVLRLGLDFLRDALGVREIYTGCVPSNAAALRLYRSVGFVETHVVDELLELRYLCPEKE